MLSEETLNRYEIERPLHRGSFDIRTDIPVALPCITSISTYAVRLEGDDVFVTLRA
jgi:nitrite reductase/ring-hydroxylating ferredoxin subunit